MIARRRDTRRRGRSAAGAGRDDRGFAPLWLLLLLVVAVGVNVRATFGATPPLVDDIGADLGLNATLQSLLTAVPVLAMGLCAPLGQLLGARFGPERAIFGLVLLLGLGGVARLGVDSVLTLMLCAVVTGAAMGATSALVPGFISRHLRRIPGTATGVYSMSMASGVALAAWIAWPTTEALGDWRASLALWGGFAILTAVGWLLVLPRISARPPRPPAPASGAVQRGLPWRSPTAWWVTAMTTVGMLGGFSGVGWIAPILEEHGATAHEAASTFAWFQLVQLLAMVTLPTLTDLTKDRRPLFLLPLLSSIAGVSMLMAVPDGPAVLAALLFGFGVGGTSALVLVLIQDTTRDQTEAGRLSAMVMMVANCAGALGPLALGALHDVTGGFTAGLAVVLGVVALGLAMVPMLRPGRVVEQFVAVAPHPEARSVSLDPDAPDPRAPSVARDPAGGAHDRRS
ncbi:CynX/NimT family MFS transporter [Georgenia sp. AZ-5]|uniref:MFS transporter n=1 Tax=Georgenia sp. AZ-5 TaxID=3367526 RepID=UPI00375513F7